jgi:outer membrane lipoprotein carrier protein
VTALRFARCARLAVLAALVASSVATLGAQDSTASPPVTPGALLDRTAAQYRTAHTIRAAFEQTLTGAGTGAKHQARGEYFQSGSRFALRFSDPAGDAIVSDGSSLWLYLPSSAKGQVIKMTSQAGEQLDILSELIGAPKSSYIVAKWREEPVDAHATTVLTLSPRKNDMPFTHATVWIGKADGLVWQLETVEQSGLTRRVRFTAVAFDAELPPDALTFTVPAGVKVIDQAALMGKKP